MAILEEDVIIQHGNCWMLATSSKPWKTREATGIQSGIQMGNQNLEKYKSLQYRIWYKHQENHQRNTAKNKITINLQYWSTQVLVLQFEWKQSFYIFIPKGGDFTYVLLNEKVRTDLKSSNCPRPEALFFKF